MDMPAGRATGRRRASTGRAPSRERSTALLLRILEDAAAISLLREAGLDPGRMRDAVQTAEREQEDRFDREPVDWHQRLLQRGFQEHSPMDALLAIARSPDTRAYQALEFSGLRVTSLRKKLVEHARRHPMGAEDSAAEGRVPERPRRRSERVAGREADRGRAAAAHDTESVRHHRRRTGRPGARGAQDSLVEEAAARPVARPPMKSHAHATDEGDELRPLCASHLPPLHGRAVELASLGDAMMRAAMRAPLLVGAHGSGRSLVASHLAAVIPAPVYVLDATEYGDEEQLRRDLDTVAREDGVVVFDDLDRVATEGPPAFLPALTHAWAHASPRVLTVVSHETRAQLEAWMPGVLETLDIIQMEEVTDADHVAALQLAAPGVFARHRVTPSAGFHLGDFTRTVDQFMTGLAMPGRAMDVLDLACARVRRTGLEELTRDVVVSIVCERTGLPESRVSGTGDQDALDLESRLARTVVGHGHVLSALAGLIRRNRAGFRSGRPVATALLLGPSGVGKTEIAKTLAGALFDRDDGLLRLDMSEYSEAHAVARVVGAPPGYVGHEVGGALTDPVLKQPHRVVLLDEIEKAHRDVHQLLLQVLDEGRLTDGRGRTVDLRHTVLIMTSNLGSSLLEEDPQATPEDVLAVARAAFPVELWNRIEAPLVLRPLDESEMRQVLQRLARASSEKLHRARGIGYELGEPVIRRLVTMAGKDAALGARPLRHLLTREVESAIAEAILRGTVRPGMRLRVSLERGTIRLDPHRASGPVIAM